MFGHLHNYSYYSFQESTMLISRFVKRAKDLKIGALALTDKNNMYGAIEFKKECEKHGIKPIYGLEASIKIEGEIYPIILLACNQNGYYALVKITSDIQLSKEESIPLESLIKYKKDLFFLCSGEESILERLILKNLENEAIRYLELFQSYFNEHFYLCVQNHDIALQNEVNKKLIFLAESLKIKVVWGNQNAYLHPSEALTIDYLKASRKQVVLPFNHEPKTNQCYLKGEKEIIKLFSQGVLDETSNLIERCQADIPLNKIYMPKFPVKGGLSSALYLNELCKAGLKKRFNQKSVPVTYIKRLNNELEIINSMNFSDYFLIVWDYVRYAKINNILVGPGRGSSSGSLVAYTLGITNVDPLKYDLIFERFLNPERISMPDIDIDFQDDRRDEVVNYLTGKYGYKHVAQIVTFNTYGPKVAIKDLGKVAGIPLGKLETLSKLIPTSYKFKKSAKEVYQTSAQFQNIVNKDGAIQKFLPSVFTTERLLKNISTHAAGVVLCDVEIDKVVPLTLGPTKTMMTQYSKDYIEDAGLLKMDILGLRNLKIIASVLKSIEESTGEVIEISSIPLDDSKTYEMIAGGDTFGVFQLESDGMVSLLRKIKVSEFEDLIVSIALYRPGPMENIPHYLKRRHGQEEIDYIHPDLKNILKPTYGIIIYQEQILQIATKMAGFSLGKADILRKSISKKALDLMEGMEAEFIDGSIKNGYSKDIAIQVFDLIARFANYGFPRSHSVAYAIIAYQIAYLKANYPLAFFASLLSNVYNSDAHKLACIQEMGKYNIKILPPSINVLNKDFLVEEDKIRYSLLSIKNVGYAAFQAIFEEREKNGSFINIFDFFVRMLDYKLSGKVIESLIDAGVFDEFNFGRRAIKENLNDILNYALVNKTMGIDEKPIIKPVKESKEILLEKEKEVLGVYLTTHPVVLYREKVKKQLVYVNQYMKYLNNKIETVLCLQRVRIIRDKKGNYMCFITGFDETGTIDGVVFSNVFAQYQAYLNRGSVVLINGKIEFKDQLSLIVNSVELI